MKRPLRLWIGLLASLCLMALVVTLLVSEVRFGLDAVPTTAKVDRYTKGSLLRRGGGTAVHLVQGQAVRGTFRTWQLLGGPREGDLVPVRYRPSEPDRLALDSFPHRYGPLALPLLLALASAIWSGLLRRRRAAA